MKVAQLTLAAARNGNLDAQVKATRANLTAARERLKSDETRLEVIQRGPTDEDVAQAQAGIDQAQQQLNKARQPYTTYDLRQQEQAVLQAQAQLARIQNPYTEQDLAAAQSAVDQARAQLDLAQLGVRETTVTAPVDGVIADRLVSPGAIVNQQSPLVTLVPPALELVVNVEESQLGQVAEGQNVQLSVAAYPGQTFTGTVRSIAPTVESKSRTSLVRIEPNDGGSLRAGMFAQATIVTAQKSNALLVPNEALVGGSTLIVIDDANTAHRAPVKLGLRGERFAEVLSGVEAGQTVAISNPADLQDGDVVAPRGNTAVALAR